MGEAGREEAAAETLVSFRAEVAIAVVDSSQERNVRDEDIPVVAPVSKSLECEVGDGSMASCRRNCAETSDCVPRLFKLKFKAAERHSYAHDTRGYYHNKIFDKRTLLLQHPACLVRGRIQPHKLGQSQ